MGDNAPEGGLNYDSLLKKVKVLLEVLGLKSFGEKIFQDLKSSWWQILLAICLGGFVSFMWVIMMRFIAAVMVWSSILLSIGLLGMYSLFKITCTYFLPQSWVEFKKFVLEQSFSFEVLLVKWRKKIKSEGWKIEIVPIFVGDPNLTQYNMHSLQSWKSLLLFVSGLSCVYCGFKFTELGSNSNFDMGGFELTTDFGSYLELSQTWMVFLIISGITLLIILLLLCFMFTRIKIAIELIEEGSIAVGHMMSTLFFPFIPFVMEVIFVAWFFTVAAFLSSWNEEVMNSILSQYSQSQSE